MPEGAEVSAGVVFVSPGVSLSEAKRRLARRADKSAKEKRSSLTESQIHDMS